MSAVSAQVMSGLVTLPYRQGAETMEITLGADAGGFTSILPYDFREYRARYNADPMLPVYVIFPRTNTSRDVLQLAIEFSFETTLVNAIDAVTLTINVASAAGFPLAVPFSIRIDNEVMTVTAIAATTWNVTRAAEGTAAAPHSKDSSVLHLQTTSLIVQPKTFANTSFVIPLPPNAGANLRLRRFQQLPLPLPGLGANNWGIVVLLGNISKLTWVIGREKDEIRQHMLDVQRQRLRAFAHGFSLDQFGADLRVPRFPPREHSFDANTLALYHLNESIPANGPVTDETVRFGLPGHPGVNAGALSGVNGKFGKAFLFPGETPSGSISIAHHADFNIGVNGNFTAEAFIKADGKDDPVPRIVLMKRTQESEAELLLAGWSMSLGSFRGIQNNVMWAVADGAREVKIFADINIADGKIHHFAGTVDRAAQRARLYVDGEERASAAISGFGTINNVERVRIGRSATGNQFAGVIDEVRLSNIARSDFHPVLGEGDEAYRRRLGIFESWLLPTPDNLLKTINELVQINGEVNSFRLIENDRPSAVAGKLVRILPAQLLPGQQIDRDGSARTKEADVSGIPAADADFDVMYLLRHDRAGIKYGDVENNRHMQAATKAALDTLLNLLISTAVANNLIITKSFDAADAGLHSVGRALRMTHETLALENLGVLAHQAGFDLVKNNGTDIYASVAAGEKLEIIIEPRAPAATPPPDVDVFVTRAIDLHLAPEALPVGGEISWTLISCAAGRAHFEKHPDDAPALRTAVTSRQHLRLVADAPGEVTLRVEYTFARQTVSGTRTILISIDALGNNETIAANGDRKIAEAAAAGTPETVFNPIYLITSNANVSFGASPNNRRMQIVLERPFKRLLQLLEGIGAATNQLQVLKAFDPAGPGLHTVGRAIRFGHIVLDPGTLGALAHRAGFDFVRRTGAEIFAAVAEGEKIEVVGSSDLAPLSDEITAGTPVDIEARFSTLPGSGNFNWALTPIGNGKGVLDFVLRPKVKFSPRTPGLLALSVTFLEQDPQSTFPYTFEIRLKDSLDVPGTIIPKHQYDLLMNILNYFHPIGVEVVTRNIREHVVEIQGNLLNLFPGYTYPDFRA
jgi:hypothetical protein